MGLDRLAERDVARGDEHRYRGDLTRGGGRFNAAQGAVATAQGVGAALSATLAGLIIVSAGYSTAFLALAAIAALGFVLFLALMPETRDKTAAGSAPESGSGLPPTVPAGA